MHLLLDSHLTALLGVAPYMKACIFSA